MKYSLGVKNAVLKQKVGDVLNQYDKDKNGISKDEFNSLINNTTSIFAKPFITEKALNKVQKQLDTDSNGTIDNNELAAYVKKELGVDFKKAKNMTVNELVDLIEAKDAERKKNKKGD